MKKRLKTAVYIQARYSSSRLPKKLFLPLAGKSVLQHIIERTRLIKKLINYIVVVVPDEEKEVIREHLKDSPDVIVYGGDKENVLKRFYDANKKIQADIIIRLTADNPLVDTLHLRKALLRHIKQQADYTIYKYLPLGCGFEILSKYALERCFKNANKVYQKEHVTPYIRENKQEFKILELVPYKFYRRPEYRLTIDEEPDYKLIEIIYKHLYKGKPINLREVLKFLEAKPELLKINKDVKQVIVP